MQEGDVDAHLAAQARDIGLGLGQRSCKLSALAVVRARPSLRLCLSAHGQRSQ